MSASHKAVSSSERWISILGLDLKPDESIIQAVVVGAAFLPKFREIKQACGEAQGYTTWFIVGDEASSKSLGSRLKKELEIWLKEGGRKDNSARIF
jgi:hypothetical protein